MKVLALSLVLTFHRGSWQERQMYDYNPFALPHTDRRAQVEFYLPLIFYMFAWLVRLPYIYIHVRG